MNNRRKSRSNTRQTCKLLQCDISTAFNKWWDIARINMKKKQNYLVKSAIAIDVDSDSESSNEDSERPEQPRIYYVKRELPVPFSDDEDDRDIESIPDVQLNREDSTVSGTESNISSTLKQIAVKQENPENESTIYEQRSVQEKHDHIIIKGQVILPPPCNTTNSSGSHSRATSVSDKDKGKPKIDNSRSPGTKRISETERGGKKQKIHQSDSTGKKLNSSGSATTSVSDASKSKIATSHNTGTIKRVSETKTNENKQIMPQLDKTVTKSNSSGTPTSVPDKSKSKIATSHSSWTKRDFVTDRDGGKQKIRNIKQSDITEKKAKADKRLSCSKESLNGVSKIPQPIKIISGNKSNYSQPNPSRSSKPDITSEDKINKKSTKPLISEESQSITAREERSKSPPTRNGTNNDTPSCSRSQQYSSIKSKIEGKKLDNRRLILITDLFKTVYQTRFLKDLVSMDKEKIELFLKMDVKYHLINLSIDESDMCDMYKVFKENQMVDTDYIEDDIIKLLNLLSPTELQDICKMYKSRPFGTTKDDKINSLLKCCRQQSNLTNMSTEDLIKKEIKQKMGKCVIRLNEEFQNAFYRTYILGTFTNPEYINMSDYFKSYLADNVDFPKYSVQDYVIFYTKDEAIRYVNAIKYKAELEAIAGNKLEVLKLCRTAFQELKRLKDLEILDSDKERYKNAPFLMQFTARYVHVKILTSAAKILHTMYPDDVKLWLEYMIVHETKFTNRIGEWYYHLTWLYMRYTKPPDYERAAKLLIQVLRRHKEHLTDVRLHWLEKRGRLLKHTVKYRINQWYHDTIAELMPRRIHLEEFPEHRIDAEAVRGNEQGRKRNYIVRDEENNKTILTVEEFALRYYLLGSVYTGGQHCEGDLIKATFTLFFWDIIYMDLPASFVSSIQTVPLDMYTQYFYLRRKDAIDKRLKQIDSEWSHDEVVKFLNRNYELHSHESGFCEPGRIIENPKLLEILVDCVGRRVLAKIYERLVRNVRQYSSGMPDLLVWNVNTKKSKFVEVKGETDSFSQEQLLWARYLKSIGADFEACHVHSIGSKRKKIDKNKTSRRSRNASESNMSSDESSNESSN